MFAKTLRKAYKIGASGYGLGWFTAICDNTHLGRTLDLAPVAFKDNFMLSGVIWFFASIIHVGLGAVICLILYFLGSGGWKFLPELPGMIWTGLQWAGWGLFYVFFAIGFVLSGIGAGVVAAWGWLVENIPLAFGAVIDFLTSAKLWLAIWTVVMEGRLGRAGACNCRLPLLLGIQSCLRKEVLRLGRNEG